MSDLVVGAGTVRADDPSLTVRHVDGADPVRIVLGSAPPEAAVQPATEFHGDPAELLDQLGDTAAPLAAAEDWVTTECPKCGGTARRWPIPCWPPGMPPPPAPIAAPGAKPNRAVV